MHVLVTGGTGFVGAHTVKALAERGHSVRLLVRSPERVGPALEPLGVQGVDDVVVGDVTDRGVVEQAVDGCDAVVHSASVYTLDVRRAEEIRKTNVQGTRNVLEAAVERGLDPIVHISSYVALVPIQDSTIAADSPVGTGLGAYSQSKAESEQVAREFQAAGHPVVTILPGSVWGPHDPHFGESHQIATNFLKGRMPMLPRGGRLPVVDVRDVAKATAGAVEPGKGARGYLLAGHVVGIPEIATMMQQVTDRKVRWMRVPTAMTTMGGPMYSAFQRISPWRLPMAREGLRIAAQNVEQAADENVRSELGVEYRPFEVTIRDTVASLVETGKLGKEAGVLRREAQETAG